jgi:hypothetical protein
MTSAFDEGEQIDIDDIGMRGCHAVRILLVDLERAVLQKLAQKQSRGPDRYDEGLDAVVLCLCAPIIPWRQPRLQGENTVKMPT